MANWTTAQMPSQQGRTAVVTGANSGLGLEAARVLAEKGATVIMACRSATRGQQAAATIRRAHPAATLEVEVLDLANLGSIQRFAEAVAARHATLELLINNAGVMALPYGTTADGFEQQFGTNHLGHFALTGRLLPLLHKASAPRVVTVSSNVHRQGSLDLDNVAGKQGYSRWRAYAQSKLANLLFAFELQRRLEAVGWPLLSVAAHPGYTATNLQRAGARADSSRWAERFWGAMNRLVAQKVEMGTLPLLYAATAPDIRGCDYVGPAGFMAIRGYPAKERAAAAAYDPILAAALWERSEALTGVRYTLPTAMPQAGEPLVAAM